MVDKATYVCKLVLIFHAATVNASIWALLPSYTHRHYRLLTRLQPDFFPPLALSYVGQLPSVEEPGKAAKGVSSRSVEDFAAGLATSLSSLGAVQGLWSSRRFREAVCLLQGVKRGLDALAAEGEALVAACAFHSLYIDCLATVRTTRGYRPPA